MFSRAFCLVYIKSYICENQIIAIMKKYSLLNSLTVLVSLTLIIYSCQKSDPDVEEAQYYDVYSNALSSFFAGELNGLKEFYNLEDASQGGSQTLEDGTVVVIPANAFVDENGNVISGEVGITVASISGAADMALTNIASVSNGQMIVSGGVVNIEASQGGSSLQLGSDIQLSVPNSFENNTTGGGSVTTAESDMQFFIGQQSENGSINWEVDESQEMTYNTVTDSYDFSTSSVGFINCDAFITDPNNCGNDTDDDGLPDESCYTDVSVNLPDGFESSSCQVWIHFNDLSSLIALSFSEESNSFEIENVLGEQTIHFIVLAEKNGGFYSHFYESGLQVPNHTHPLNASLMTATTTDDWKEEVNSLP